ncbi:hypothetical protein GCM10027189_32270 [Rufibacter soli]
MKLTFKLLLIIAAIIVNDMLVKTYAGGTHDLAGAAWINLFSMSGLFLAATTTFIDLIRQKQLVSKSLLFSALLLVIVGAYLSYFGLFGLTQFLPASNSIKSSKEKGVFNSMLKLSNHTIVYEADTISLLYGWTEGERRIKHQNLIKKQELTGQIIYIIKAHHNLKPYLSSVYYKVNSDDVNGAIPIDSTITFTLPKSDSLVYLTFFKLRSSIDNDTIVKVIKVTNLEQASFHGL